jgi:hypothetical protein
MSTLKALSTPSTLVTLGDNEPVRVYGFSSKSIATLLENYPELIAVFRDVRMQAATAQAKGEGFAIGELITIAIESAITAIGKGALGEAVIHALRVRPKTAAEWDEAFEDADNLPTAWQIQLVVAAFSLTMPEIAENFRKAISSLSLGLKSETDSSTGSEG